jgi:hypothetical protein
MSNIKVDYPLLNKNYRHYKGGRYRVISMATHTETEEAMVFYSSILFGSNYVRPLASWNEPVIVNGEKVERFTLEN